CSTLRSLRTTSRSETMPCSETPSVLTTNAPILCSANASNSSVTVADGVIVCTAPDALDLRMSCTSMASPFCWRYRHDVGCSREYLVPPNLATELDAPVAALILVLAA